MLKTISITYFRNNISLIADKVAKGLQFIVTRRSKPVFRVQPVDALKLLKKIDG